MSMESSNFLHPETALDVALSFRVSQAQRVSSKNSTLICDLSAYVIYEVTGSEANAFLQGQFCNDIAKVSATHAQITGYCTPKGRLLALPTIVGFEHGYRLIVPVEVADAFIKRLSMFVMRADVQIKHKDDWVATGLIAGSNLGQNSGEGDAQVQSCINAGLGDSVEQLGALPAGALSVATNENSQLIRWHSDFSGNGGSANNGKDSLDSEACARYLRLAPIADQRHLWGSFDEVSRCTDAPWRLADVSAGVPTIRLGVVEAFVPQMLNLQLIDGLSFTKGCYPGQEIVARMQYLGKLKRHMRVFSLSTDLAQSNSLESIDRLLSPGQALLCGTDEAAGVVVDAQPQSDSSVLVLAVTKVKDPNDNFALGPHALVAREMPYTLPTLEVE